MRYFNDTNTCERCQKDLNLTWHPYREYKNGKFTGKWICDVCYSRDRNNKHNSTKNELKYVADFRTGNLDINSNTAKGYIFEQITCKVRRVKNLNIIENNFHFPLDHSRDSELGTIQSKGAVYDPFERVWGRRWANDSQKDFDNLIFYCLSKDRNKIERVYIFPWEEVINRSGVSIYKNPSRIGWYEKYRIDEKPYDGAYQQILVEIYEGKDRIIKTVNTQTSKQ